MRRPIRALPSMDTWKHRRLYCAHYQECLDLAVARRWQSFVCTKCGAAEFLDRPNPNDDYFDQCLSLAREVFAKPYEHIPDTKPDYPNRRLICKVEGCGAPVARQGVKDTYGFYCLTHGRERKRDMRRADRAKQKLLGRGPTSLVGIDNEHPVDPALELDQICPEQPGMCRGQAGAAVRAAGPHQARPDRDRGQDQTRRRDRPRAGTTR